MDYSKNILLTGAGYTANYGGFLASDMYEKIFNNSRINSLSDIARGIISNSDDLDYEGIYSEIDASNDINPKDKTIARELVIDAYKALDKELKSDFNKAGGTYSKVGRTLIQRIIGRGSQKGFFFTLNQDLLHESRSGMKAYGIPIAEAAKLNKKQVLERKDFVQLPNLSEIEKLKGRVSAAEGHVGDYRDLNDLNYIKLHGSYGWLSADGSDGMIFGKNKPRDLEKEPLLAFYLWLFREVLCRDGATLVVIGYSFRDKHINDVILDAVKNYHLRLVIVGNMKKIKNQLCYSQDDSGVKKELETKAIWEARVAQFDKKLVDIFEDTNDGNLNTFAEDLLNKLS
ncbi:MAG: hypothetical protein WC843_03115 [Candidatus Gracilibacteria bacterium]|jgi:hypothetical protein